MSLVRWNPVRDLTTWDSMTDILPDLTQIQREMNRMFDQFFRGGQVDDGTYGRFLSPAVDILENDDSFVVEAELPGLTKDDVKISIEGNILTIRGEKKRKQTEGGRNYHRSEQSYGSFLRSFTLPSSVKTDKIDANYVNGILTINLPKVEEAKPKAIEVKVK
jgi:HSP20 family protein